MVAIVDPINIGAFPGDANAVGSVVEHIEMAGVGCIEEPKLSALQGWPHEIVRAIWLGPTIFFVNGGHGSVGTKRDGGGLRHKVHVGLVVGIVGATR